MYSDSIWDILWKFEGTAVPAIIWCKMLYSKANCHRWFREKSKGRIKVMMEITRSVPVYHCTRARMMQANTTIRTFLVNYEPYISPVFSMLYQTRNWFTISPIAEMIHHKKCEYCSCLRNSRILSRSKFTTLLRQISKW